MLRLSTSLPMFGNTILRKLKTELSKKSYVVGFVLVGSYTREKVYTANKYSDLEVYIIVEDRDVSRIEKELIEVADSLGNVIFHYKNRWAGFSIVFDNLFRLELPIIKKSELKTVFSRPVAQSVEILIDRTNGELKKILDLRPKKINYEALFQDIVLDFWYMAVVSAQYFKKGEYWNARHVIEIVLVPSLIKLFELLDNKDLLLLETNKRIEQFLKKQRLNILRQISSSYDKEKIRMTINLCLGEFDDACSEVEKKYGYVYQREMVEKIKPKLRELLA